jgi:hypothetical protein
MMDGSSGVRRRRPVGPIAFLALLPAVLQGAPLSAQTAIEALADQCPAEEVELRAWCTEVALAFQAAQGGVGIAATGGGSLFPGNASTLGRRLPSSPRISGNLQLSGVRFHLPDVLDYRTGPASGRSVVLPGVHATVGVGLFDGFSPIPTVGGILGVDGILSGSFIALPGGSGFRENTFGYGIGVRVGLLRESFTLPGVSVSALRRGTRSIRLGDPLADGPAEVEFGLSSTSLRATVGKDFLIAGFLAGVGHDRLRSNADLAARTGAPGDPDRPTGRMAARGFRNDRTTWFAGATLTFLIAQLAAEGGWVSGYDPVPGRPASGSAYDPGRGSVFLTLAARLTL